MVNIATNPTAKSIGVVIWIEAFHRVADQLSTFTPVGMAISIVKAAKTLLAIGPIPTANMWWAQTVKPRNPIEMPEKTIAV